MVWIGIEGCDGTGKTSLAEAVKREIQHRVSTGKLPDMDTLLIHRGPPEKSVLEEYATDVEGLEDKHLVFDRWHLGTLVYAPLYRDTGPYGELGVAGFRWVEKFLEARSARFFVIDQPYDTVKRRLEARGEDYLQAHDVEGVLERFRVVNGLSILTEPDPVVPPDGTEYVESTASMLVDQAIAAQPGVEPARSYSSYVGGPAPKYLLVGEKRGGTPPFASQAAFMPLKNKSGEYLWNALPEDMWRDVGVANAYEDDIHALWAFLGCPQLVALGGRAAAKLRSQKLQHVAVPHPQWVKRFHNARQAEYGELIRRAATTGENVSWPS